MSEAPPPDAVRLHASAVVVDEAGILIRGPSGSGKSRLARELLSACEAQGRHGALVGDDCVAVSARHGRLVVRGVQEVAGLLEVRGVGIVRVAHVPAAVVRLVVECGREAPRLPDPHAATTTIAGIACPLLAALAPSADLVLWRLRVPNDAIMTVS